MSKHTPGPMRVDRIASGFRIAGPSNETVALMHMGNGRAEPTALLFAAAPDLLAACKRLVESWTVNGEGIYHGVVANQVRAAIAKAEGQA